MRRSILVVDDHPVTRGDLVEAVASLHLTSLPAASVDEAVPLLNATAAILLDADLPSVVDLLNRIEQLPPDRRPAVILLRTVGPVRARAWTIALTASARCSNRSNAMKSAGRWQLPSDGSPRSVRSRSFRNHFPRNFAEWPAERFAFYWRKTR